MLSFIGVMELCENTLECRVAEVSSGKRDEILLLVDSGYSRRTISRQTKTTVDVIEYLVANRMSESNVSSDEDSDSDMAEPETVNSSVRDLDTGSRSMSSPVERQKNQILQLRAEGHNQKEIAKRVGINRFKVYQILKSAGKVMEKPKNGFTPSTQQKTKVPCEEGLGRENVGIHRKSLSACPESNMPTRKRTHGSAPTAQQETAILQLFKEGVVRDEIVRRVQVKRDAVTNVLLLHGQSFVHRRCAKSPAPLRATEQQKSRIGALLEKGHFCKQIARQLGMDERIVKREIYLAQRMGGIKSNSEEVVAGVSMAEVHSQNTNPLCSIDSDVRLSKDLPFISNRERSPEYAEPRASTSISPSASDGSSSDHGSLAVRVFREAATNSISDCPSPVSEKRNFRLDEKPASSPAECADGDLSYISPNAEDGNFKDMRRETVATYSTDTKPTCRCDICPFETRFEAVFISHLLGTRHAFLAGKGVILRCTSCPFRTRQPNKMVGHVVTYQFHCLPDRADLYSIVTLTSS